MPMYAILMVLLLLVLTAPFAFVIVKKTRALTARPDLLRAMAPSLGMGFQEVVVSDETRDETDRRSIDSPSRAPCIGVAPKARGPIQRVGPAS